MCKILSKQYILILIIFVIVTACKSDTNKSTEVVKTPTVQNQTVPRAEQSFVQDLFNRVDQIDYIFNTFDFSMSITEPNAVKSNIATLSGDSVGSITTQCKPIGRQMFMSKGEMLAEADLYFSEGCHYLIFVEKEKPVSGSKFNDRGIEFYNSVFAQANGAR